MVEVHTNKPDAGYWGYLIKSDKSAAPQLEQLCLGLAQKICELEPGPPKDRLTPRRLAAFYRSVGGNLDTLFLRTTESGLSFLYRTIGCFHSLEPSANPFKTPSLPCLTPEGFVKWQTVQLLLCPDEHVGYLQKAVQVYEVPRPDGGIFPRSIPRESFPPKADVEMEEWHKRVTSQLNQESYMSRLKNSPYQSPYQTDRPDGYFSTPIPKIRRPSRSSRSDSREGERPQFNNRRSSEPDFHPAANPVDYARNPQAYPPDARIRSTSGNRPGLGSRQRSATTGHPTRPNASHSGTRHPQDHPPNAYFRGQYADRSPRIGHRHSPSGSSMGDSSAEDASSEDSRGQRRSRTPRVVSSLLSVLPFGAGKRRSQSHDASAYLRERRSPQRNENEMMTPPPRASTEATHLRPTFVRFKQDMFDNAASAPESASKDRRSNSAQRPDQRYARNPGLTDPSSPVNYNLTRTSSGSGSENRSQYDMPFRQQRKPGAPLRTTTQTGVKGRKYASIENDGPPPPMMSPKDQQTRYSLAV